MKVQIMHLPSNGDPRFAVVFSEVTDDDMRLSFSGQRVSMAQDLGAETVLVFHDSIEVVDA